MRRPRTLKTSRKGLEGKSYVDLNGRPDRTIRTGPAHPRKSGRMPRDTTSGSSWEKRLGKQESGPCLSQPPFEQLRLSNPTSTRNYTPESDVGGFSDNWRRGGDSNSRYPHGYSRFRGGRDRPLCHLSANWTLVYHDRPCSRIWLPGCGYQAVVMALRATEGDEESNAHR